MVNSKHFAAVIAALLTVIATGCITSFEPQTAVNPVGTEHTVTVTIELPDDFDEEEAEDALCDLLEEIFPEFEECQPEQMSAQAQVGPASHIQHDFEVISGPNQGEFADEGDDDIVVEPFEDGARASWTYRSNGVPGTDVIRYCNALSIMQIELFYEFYEEESEDPLSEEEFYEAIVDFSNDQFGTDFDSLEDIFCRTVTKTWVEERRPSIGAGLSGLFAGQPTALPTAPAPAAVAPSTTIRPPSTGDAGLK